MAERRTGLGKGLGALIPSGPGIRGGAAEGPETGQGPRGPARRRPVDLLFNSSQADDADRAGQADPAARAARGGENAQSAGTGAGGRARPARGGAKGAATAAAAAGGGSGADGAELVAVPGAEFAMIPLAAIQPNPRQPRQVFDEDALQELADSIKEVGLLQPVVVRPLSGPAADGPEGAEVGSSTASGEGNATRARGGATTAGGAGTGIRPGAATAADAGRDALKDGRPEALRYELVMGERRWRACQLAGLDEVPAIVRATEDSDLLRDALLENLHRAQLNPLEEAAAYRQLLDDFSCTQDELAAKIARSRPQISNTLRLLKLPPLVQRRLAAGVLSAGHARALLSLSDAAAMERMAQKVVAEGLSVRTTEELVSLGEVPPEAKPKRAAVRAGAHRQALDGLQDRLADRFDTKVTVNLGKAKGRVVIEFASVADLNRIVHLLDPSDPGVLK